ncbi:MAG: quinoprotein dehydrogenase-associated SoxYZ-like carrier [Burkholderiales bacterium]|nr:quinoprotein dehydrogenase-associated SoxYZ-like carrier [Burkholderiales bacterium]MDE2157505.1 quinoprotein dehydrogenase-associated SoxYZ-like carrier [Burkholderiales bacterium]MDE2503149.1 quinoprotein dehydrogenase-associated SoxYZ-like carrier [Burkholderiales bacterium]
MKRAALAAVLACAAALALPAPVAAAATTAANTTELKFAPTDDPQASPIWRKIRAGLFEGRPIADAPPGLLVLDAPRRAIDAAVVPVAIHTHLPAGSPVWVQRLVLVLDANPSPIVGIFGFTPDSGRADVETRVRVDAYGWIRAVAETSDGRLYAVTHFIKASGGCSAAPGGDAAAAAATLGRMRLRVEGDPQRGEPVAVQLAIQHPNDSGMVMDQLTRQYVPPHYVRQVRVSYDGRPVFTADVDFGIAENPNFRFYVQPHAGGELRATMVDTSDREFTVAQPLAASP